MCIDIHRLLQILIKPEQNQMLKSVSVINTSYFERIGVRLSAFKLRSMQTCSALFMHSKQSKNLMWNEGHFTL